MENPKVATMRQVKDTFAAWKTAYDEVKAMEKAVRHHDPKHSAPLAQLQSELQALRLESDRLLLISQQALLTIKTPRSSSGDSTWG